MIGLDYDKLDEMNNTNSELEKFVPQIVLYSWYKRFR